MVHISIFQLTTSRRGRQIRRKRTEGTLSFNSRPHAEVDVLAICMYHLYQIFQLTTSRRGRPQKIHRNAIISIFQLTTSRRGRRNLLIPCCTSLSFQLTTSRRGRPPPGATVWLPMNPAPPVTKIFIASSFPHGPRRPFSESPHSDMYGVLWPHSSAFSHAFHIRPPVRNGACAPHLL